MDKEYFLEIEERTIAYVYFKTEQGEVTEFVVKLLSPRLRLVYPSSTQSIKQKDVKIT